jgi:hypothetical protein
MVAAAGAFALPVAADTTPTFVGSISTCSGDTGSVVAVDFAGASIAPYGSSDLWGGPVALGCDTSNPAHGINLLTDTGFTTAGDKHDGPAFICRIGSPLFNGGTPYPTPAQDPCIVTPPATAYWSYWLAGAGANDWTYSSLGAYSDVPKPGEIEAWTFGGTNIAGTTGQPSFTPQQVRDQETASRGGAGSGGSGGVNGPGAGGPGAGAGSGTGASGGGTSGTGGSATTTSASGTSKTGKPSGRGGAKRPNVARAVRYLVGTTTANSVAGGTTLAADGYYESAPKFADYGLTIDGAFAIAATHGHAAVLNRVVAFIAGQHKDGSGRSVNTWTEIGTKYANGGSIGKEALLAEVVGRDPRRFAGHNLIATLDELLCTKRNSTSCVGGAGSFAYGTSTFDQALAIMAQLRARDSRNARPAIAYLQHQQHRNGAWPSLIPSTGDSDVDSTAMATMALAVAPGKHAAHAVERADSWLAHRQERDGGFPGAAGNSTNSTALAVQALKLSGRKYTKSINRALTFLAAEQNPDGGFNIAAAGRRGSDVRASTQVVGGIIGTSFGTLHAGPAANKR